MKQTKRILSVVLCLVMLLAVVPVMEAGAATFEDINSSVVFLKQQGSSTCTLVSAAMMMRRYAMLRGDSDWDTITESSLKPTAWSSGLRWSFTYKNVSVNTETLPTGSENTSRLISLLSNHPEGIVLYRHVDSNHQHAVLLTDYTDGTFYCADPLGSVASGRIPISQAYWVTISGATQYWYVTSPRVDYTPTYTEPPTAPTVSVDKKIALINDDVTISFSSERASNYWIGIYSDGDLWTQDVVYENSYTISYAYVGTYNVVVVARNNCGDATGYASFKLGHEGDYKPTNFTVTADKTIALRDETINISFSADNANRYWIGVYTSGNYCYVSENVYGNSFSVALPWLGNYHATVVAINDCSDSTAYINLTVVEKKAFSVTYNANGGSGAPSAQTKTYGADLILSSQKPTRSGFTFVSWNTKADGTGTSYRSGATYEENADLTLYAIWQQNHTHSYTSTVTKAATCSATGVRTYTCSCGDSYTETIPVNSGNHVNTTNVSATASTCTVKGYTAGVYCNDCKKYISGHEEQPLAAHTLTTINQKAAGCTEAGYTGDQYCTTCKQTITRGSAINALGHASADGNGNCTRCGAHIKDVTPPQPQPNPNACKWCGEVHTGFFGKIVGFFHSILAIFKR